jgi:hypothetical protein
MTGLASIIIGSFLRHGSAESKKQDAFRRLFNSGLKIAFLKINVKRDDQIPITAAESAVAARNGIIKIVQKQHCP